MFNKKKKANSADRTISGTYEQLPAEYLTWDDAKKREFIRDLLRSVSPGKLSSDDK